MDSFNKKDDKKDNDFTDPILEKEENYSTEVELKPHEYPKSFTSIPERVIKCVSLYLQLLWNANPNGKTESSLNVFDILENAKNLFGTKYETRDIYVMRHIAADLREIVLFNGFQIKKYFKNIDIDRLDITYRLELNRLISKYFSTVIHFNYTTGDNSYEQIKKINEKLNLLKINKIEIPSNEQNYLKKNIFENIFEQVSIVFIMNYYEIFSEFLFSEDGNK